jgi:hypothetical protein
MKSKKKTPKSSRQEVKDESKFLIEDLKKVLDENDFSWMKVKQFKLESLVDLTAEEKFNSLMIHHERETKFLIAKCRQIATLLLASGYYDKPDRDNVSVIKESEVASAPSSSAASLPISWEEMQMYGYSWDKYGK